MFKAGIRDLKSSLNCGKEYNLRAAELNLVRERAMKTTVVAALFACVFTTAAVAWGDRGHSIVAEIAQRHLAPKAIKAGRRLPMSRMALAS